MKSKVLPLATVLLLCSAFSISPRTAGALEPQRARFRITLTEFKVNHATTDNILSTDGQGDEIYLVANFAELLSSNNILGALQTRLSLVYGDISAAREPIRLGGALTHLGQPWMVKAGHASSSGGLITGDSFPVPGEDPRILSQGREPNAMTIARLLPMIFWEGELRQDEAHPNAIVLIPTIWENDNVKDVLEIWNRQADNFLRRFATTSAPCVNGTTRCPLVQRVGTVLSTTPHRNDFDRPIGMDGSAFNPLSADPGLATFNPALVLLTFDSAQRAVNEDGGVIKILYNDGQNYGPGSYTIFLRVERLP